MAQSTKRKRFVFHQGKLDMNQKHLQKGKEDNGSHKDFLEKNKANVTKVKVEMIINFTT